MRFSGNCRSGVGSQAPLSHDASGTLTSCAPKIER